MTPSVVPVVPAVPCMPMPVAAPAADGAPAGAAHPLHGHYAHLRVGDCHFAVPVAQTVQAMRLPDAGLTALPRRRGALAGLVDVDGQAVPVVALDRWLPIGQNSDRAEARLVILQAQTSRLAIQVDALLGMTRIEMASVRRVHQVADAEELFDKVAPATADRPLLCLLEIERLMTLAAAWCDEADIEPAATRQEAVARRSGSSGAARHAVVTIGDKSWAIPASSIAELAWVPTLEMRRPGQRICGICPWSGRKLPMVDLAPTTAAGSERPRWMLVVVHDSRAIALVMNVCERFLDLMPRDIVPVPGDGLRAGSALVDGLGSVGVLDVAKLFDTVPESRISRLPSLREPLHRSAVAGPSSPPADGAGPGSDYLVFEADRRYASPVAGILGVMVLPQSAIDELYSGDPATISWRGRTLNVINLPSIDGANTLRDPRLAVVIESADADGACIGVAVRSLNDWLPAQAVRRSRMKNPTVGEISMITAQRANETLCLVVVDLPQMAYLLG